MMATFAFYFLKVILCSAMLYGYYLLFLRNKIYHAYNRFYLLASVLVSMVAPLLNVQLLLQNNTNAAAPIQLLQAVNNGDLYLEEVIISSHRNNISTSEIIAWLYIVVSLILLTMMIKMFVVIFQLLKHNSSMAYQNIVFIETEARGTPFSFFKFIFWNKAINVHSITGQQILAHELAHVREKHSLDKLCMNFTLVFYWINPFFWIIKKELNLIHEFIADKKAVVNYDTATLAAMIVTAAYPTHSYLITNHFFYSPIKRRLNMLTAYPSKKAGYFYRVLALPVIVLLLAAFTLKTSMLKDNSIPNPAKKIKVMIDAGHGGDDKGASSVDGIREKDLNLALLQKIKSLNTASNIELVFTRETDLYQSPREKVAMAKANQPELFVSIHIASSNGISQNKFSGLEVFVAQDRYPNSQSSKEFASAVIAQFKSGYDLNVAAQPIQRTIGIHVLSGNIVPAILIHAGYINNPTDLAYLQSAKGQEAIAINILKAIARYADRLPVEQNSLPTSIASPIKSDTTPTSTAKVQYYNKVAIKAIKVGADKKTLYLTLANGETETISLEEAKLANIEVPNVQNKSGMVTIKKVDEYENISADQFGQKQIPNVQQEKFFLRGKQNPLINDEPMYILDGKVVNNHILQQLDPETIKSITVLKGDAAFAVYKTEQSKKGVVEIITKDSKSTTSTSKAPPASLSEDDNKVFNKVEQEALFPGGIEAWKLFLRENLDPNIAVDEGKSIGNYQIIMQFIVKTDGTITGVVAETYKDTKMAAACIELLMKSPKWIPAKQKGKPVNAYRRQPITFAVSEG